MGAANTNAINDVYEIVVTDADRETAKTVWNMKDIPFQVRANLVCVALSRRNLYYVDDSVTRTEAKARFILEQIEDKFDIQVDANWRFCVVKLGQVSRLGVGVFDRTKNSEYLFDNEPTNGVGPYIDIDLVVVDELNQYKGRVYSEKTTSRIETSRIRELYATRKTMREAIQMVEPTFSVELWIQPSLSR